MSCSRLRTLVDRSQTLPGTLSQPLRQRATDEGNPAAAAPWRSRSVRGEKGLADSDRLAECG